VDVGVGRVGTLVCWDQWYPEAARLTALQGAEVLFYPTAIGWHPAEKDEFGARNTTLGRRSRGRTQSRTGVYVAGVNRVGIEQGDVLGNRAQGQGIEFWVAAFWPHPFGALLPRPRMTRKRFCWRNRLAAIEDTRRNWPFLRDRRIDAYAPIASRLSIRRPSGQKSGEPEQHGRYHQVPQRIGVTAMPAEWESHEATWLAWPHNPETGPGKFQPISMDLCGDCAACSRHTKQCTFLSRTQGRAARDVNAGAGPEESGQVSFHLWPTDRSWTARYGAIFVRNGEGRRRHHKLALQRVGQVSELPA